jgi:cysteine desulfurase family protein (TIGR01976 family)
MKPRANYRMINVDKVRSRFPALALLDDGQARIYLDNPAGTQVPATVLERMRHYLVSSNANVGGAFRTAVVSDAILREAHTAMADLLNAASPDEIIFGPNMTTLTFALSRAFGHRIKAGQEIIVTRLDHDANISPWLRLAEDCGAVIRWLDFDPANGTLRLDEFERLLTQKTVLVAVGYGSNLLGTINPIPKMVEQAHAVGALVFVDAVHYVPHAPIDVQSLGADFLVCSPYKFFGPHQGVLWGRAELLDQLPAYRVRPAPTVAPGKFETGTQNHEGQAGVLGAIEYLEWVGTEFGQSHAARFPGFGGRRLRLHCAMEAIRQYEHALSRSLVAGLQQIPGVRVWGITDPAQLSQRVPTVSFTLAGQSPRRLVARLAEQNIFAWDGHAYAVEVVKRLGLAESGGVVRVGAVHYNSAAELETLLESVRLVAEATSRSGSGSEQG